MPAAAATVTSARACSRFASCESRRAGVAQPPSALAVAAADVRREALRDIPHLRRQLNRHQQAARTISAMLAAATEAANHPHTQE